MTAEPRKEKKEKKERIIKEKQKEKTKKKENNNRKIGIIRTTVVDRDIDGDKDPDVMWTY